jgi:hypothetical protein
MMPRGKLIPVPLLCQVSFGEAMPRIAGEDKTAFLERARQCVAALEG